MNIATGNHEAVGGAALRPSPATPGGGAASSITVDCSHHSDVFTGCHLTTDSPQSLSTSKASNVSFLSPHYGSIHSTPTSGKTKQSTQQQQQQPPIPTFSTSSSPRRRRHHHSGTGSTKTATPGASFGRGTGSSVISFGEPDFLIKRSASVILAGGGVGLPSIGAGISSGPPNADSQRPRSSFGSGLHLGSSVTFCNTLGRGPPRPGVGLFPNDADSSGLRRSCSITLAYPSESVLQQQVATSGTGVATVGGQVSVGPNGSCLPTSVGPGGGRRDGGGGGGGLHTISTYPGRLALAPPVITYDGVATAPSSPVVAPIGGGIDGTGGGGGGGISSSGAFGSSYQLQTVRSKNVLVTPRGSFLTVNQSPIEFRESMLSISYPNYTDDAEEVSLVYSRLEKIPMKDFAAEIRAHLDVEHFLSQAQLMLDMPETNMEEIFDRMLRHLLENEETPAAFQEAAKVLFTHKSVRQCSKTIQSTCSSYNGGYDYDQSWLCVLCTVASVQKRHVAIARLRTPAYLGRTCQEVWFIILVVTSTKEKGTKNALETGRTFATLFADMDLRLRLLGARTENEFKQLMWEHMKELAEEQTDGNARRKHSEDSNDVKTEEAAPRSSVFEHSQSQRVVVVSCNRINNEMIE